MFQIGSGKRLRLLLTRVLIKCVEACWAWVDESMDKVWYYAAGEESVGPISLAELRAVLSRVSGANSALVWKHGFTDWVRADGVPELAPYLLKPPPLPNGPAIKLSPGETRTKLPKPAESANLHPWRRYFARMLDIYIFILIFFFLLVVIFPELFQGSQSQSTARGNDYFLWFLGLAAYVIFETICLNAFGGTFGKFLYGIEITLKESGGIPFSIALKRALAVWFRGLGLGIPLITLITLNVAYRSLLKDGEASWDRDFNCLITHRQLSKLRWLVIAIVWCFFVSVSVILVAMAR
jgi:uncharacterized RDD family membrane protein YckC